MKFFLNYTKNYILIKIKVKTLLIILLKKKIILLNIKFKTKINKNFFSIILKIKNNQIQKFKIFNKIKKTIKNYNNINIGKLYFSGKGFKIKKIKKSCLFLFNKSHNIFFHTKSLIIWKNNKNNIILIQKSKLLQKNIIFIKKIFPLNIFTKKGIKTTNILVKIKKK